VRVVVQHRSRYHYPRPALLGPQLIRLRLADHTRARIESYQPLVELAVEINAINPFDFFIDDRARKVPFVYPDGQGRHRAIGPHAPVVLTARPHRRLHDL